MMHEKTLKKSSSKKRLYLSLLRFVIRSKTINWHATDQIERRDILKWYPHSNVVVLPNLVREFGIPDFTSEKKAGFVRVLYYSIISSKKNLLFLLQTLHKSKVKFVLHVYGSIKEDSYWQTCDRFVQENQLSGFVSYFGPVNADKLELISKSYDIMALPTLGENFGHAIVECLGYGLPVLISENTPWEFEESDMSFSLKLEQVDSWVDALHLISSWNNTKHQIAKQRAYDYYVRNIAAHQDRLISAYHKLFTTS
jgi:glycosyltransferase involved in cell wall biosynthesis